MSSAYDYDDYDQPRRYRSTQTRQRERGEPDLVREETYIETGKGVGPRSGALVYRGRDADDSIEDIPRDFPPPDRRSTVRSDYYDNQRPRRAKSVGRRYSDEDTDYAIPAAAGAAGYAAGRRKERERRRRRDDRDYESEYSDSPPRKSERRKSGIEDLIGGLGLAGLAGKLTGKRDKSRDRSESRSVRSGRSGRSRSRVSRRRHYSSSEESRSRSRSRGDKKRTERKWAQAAQAALAAGAVEAFMSRKMEGPWTGEKGKRVATAALGAGGIDAVLDRNPERKTKRHLAEAVLGGIAANRLANGARSKSRGRNASVSPDRRSIRSRSRSVIDRLRGRSQSRGPRSRSRGRSVASDEGGGGGGNALKSLAAGGGLAVAGKAIYDRLRSKSRKRRSPSSSSADSYVPSRNRRRDMRRSQHSDTESTRRSLPGTDRGRDLAYRDTDNNGEGGTKNQIAAIEAGGTAREAQGEAKDGNDSDSSSTTDLERKRKGMRGKELLTAGLATVATIHAVHGVYSSMEAHEKRHKMVAEGEMSPEEARKKQTKAWVQDAAAVGIAALGIKGAFSEWKEMKEQREEIHKIEKRKNDRRKKLQQREKREQKERNEKIMQMAQQNPQWAYMANNGGMGGGMMPQMPMYNMPQMPMQQQQQVEGPRGQAPAADQSGNPYAPRDGGGRN